VKDPTATIHMNEALSIAKADGSPQAIITIHSNCKLMLLSMPPSYQILVSLVLERSVNAEDDNFAKKIEKLIADTYDAKLMQ
jgi:uncharacterized protein YbgA (DUF1722 family)